MGISVTRNERQNRGLATLFAAIMLAAIAACALALLAFPQQAHAAARTKVYYLPVKIVEAHGDSPDRETYINEYNKNGLLISVTDTETSGSGSSNESKTILERNRKGLVTGWKHYRDDALSSYVVSTIRSGKVKQIKQYLVYSDDTEEWGYTVTFTYKNGKVAKVVRKSSEGYTQTITYRANGNPKKSTYKNNGNTSTTVWTETYNKKGLPTKYVSTRKSKTSDDQTQRTYTYKYTYNKKGDPTVVVETQKSTQKSYNEAKGKVTTTSSTEVITMRNKYTYDKKGNITKRVQTGESNKDCDYSYEDTTTYTYKKFKVPKKFWEMLDLHSPSAFNSLSDLEWRS